MCVIVLVWSCVIKFCNYYLTNAFTYSLKKFNIGCVNVPNIHICLFLVCISGE